MEYQPEFSHRNTAKPAADPRGEGGLWQRTASILYEFNKFNPSIHPTNPPPPDLTLDNMNFNQIFVNIRLTLIIVV